MKENFQSNIEITVYLLGYSINTNNPILSQYCFNFIHLILSHVNELPDISPQKLHGFSKIPANKVPTIYHQITLLAVYLLSLNLNLDKIRIYECLIELSKKVKLLGDNKILFYIDELCL